MAGDSDPDAAAPAPAVVRDDLIGLMYEVAIHPQAFLALLSVWDRTISNARVSLQQALPVAEEVASHARRADEILARLDREARGRRPISIARTIAADSCSIVVLSCACEVLHANVAFTSRHGLADVSEIEAWLRNSAHGREWAQLRRGFLANAPGRPAALGVLTVQNPGDSRQTLFLLKRVQCPVDPGVGAVLYALEPVWDSAAAAAMQQHFGWTHAETGVAKRIVEGYSSEYIAAARRTSITTVRTQIKTLLAKAGLRSKIDLVRIFSALGDARWRSGADTSAGPLPGGDASANPERMRSLQAPSGIRVEYALIGPCNGTPVLYLHGMIDSLRFCSKVRALLHQRDCRLICPVRPHFGGSDAYPPGADPVEAFSTIVTTLLDCLGLDRVPVIGHMAGALYAYHLAQRHPQRVRCIVAVAGAAPMSWPWQFQRMSFGHRIAGLTARHMPAMLPLLIQGGVRLLAAGRDDLMLELMFRDAPVDEALARDGELREIMRQRFDFVTRQGHRAFEIDVLQVASDWSDLARRTALPVGLVHGRHDRVVLIGGVEALARTLKAPLVVSETSGQLVLNHRPELVFDMLERLVDT